MNVSLYQAAAAMNANSQWQDVISDNLASGSVRGFRKEALTVEAVQAGLVPGAGLDASGTPQYFTMPKAVVGTSFKPGEMDYTGDDKNAGIEGSGFFQVQLANGTIAVTRDGEFKISPQGQLVTKEGYPVLSDSGSTIKLDPHNRAALSISPSGQVKQGGETKGKIGLTDFENPQLLTETNGVYFLADNPKLQTKPATGSLREGFVEGSNTTSLSEVGNMMTAMRTFEANQHVIQIQDDRMGKVISELGSPQ